MKLTGRTQGDGQYTQQNYTLDDLKFGRSAVPEPGTWAMMLLGFGVTGYGLHRRTRVAIA